MERFLRASVYYQSQAPDARTFLRFSAFQTSNEIPSEHDFDSPFILSLSPITDLAVFVQKDRLKLVLSTEDFGVLILDLEACYNGLDKIADMSQKHILRRIDCSFSRIFLSPLNNLLAGIESGGYSISLVDMLDERKPIASLSSISEAVDSIRWRNDGLVFAVYSSFAPSNIYFCLSKTLKCQRLSYPHKDDQLLVTFADSGRLYLLRGQPEDHRELPLEANGISR